MKLSVFIITVIVLIVSLFVLIQDAAARSMGGGGGGGRKHMDQPDASYLNIFLPQPMDEEFPEKPLRLRRSLNKMHAMALPPPPEDAPQRIENAPEQPLRVRRQLPPIPEMPDMPEMPGGK